MIIPARWYAGGFGLEEFRKNMLNDKRISHLVDFESATSVFPGVDIAGGVCYFLWDKNYNGPCEIINSRNQENENNVRYLNEFDIFVRDSRAISILRKAINSEDAQKHGVLTSRVTGIKPFGLPSNYKPKSSGVACWFIQKHGRQFAHKSDFTDKLGIIKKWKVLVPKAPIAGQTDFTKPIKIYHEKNVLIAAPGEICTESYIVVGSFDTELEASNYRLYLLTKIARFLILLTIISQDVNKKNYRFLPCLGDYTQPVCDEDIKERWGFTDEEYAYIESRIKSTDA
jgi:site-specific DNA-methyltransferase (adenine-specific)